MVIMDESQNVEWKQSWHDDYLKWICGFANAEGGRIFIGKDDQGNVVHLHDFKALMDKIPNKIRDQLGIMCQVSLRGKSGQKYIEIEVPPYEVAVSLRGRYYFRSGSTKMELTGVALTDFLLKKSRKSWDDVLEPNATLSDIDEDSLNIFLKDAKGAGRMPRFSGLKMPEVLDKLRLLTDDGLKRAAIVLFGKDPNKFYPNMSVRIGRFGRNSADLRFHEIIEGNLVRMLFDTIEVLGNKFLVRKINFQGIQRIEKGEYPQPALREMLLNALIHRTFMGPPVQIRVFDEQISVWNEGTLPFGQTIETLKKVHNSRPRNPILADVCFKGGYIDTWGMGTLKIINSCADAGLPEPDIEEMDGGLMVTLYKTVSATNTGNTRNKLGSVLGSIVYELTDRQFELLSIIHDNSKVTYQQLSEKLDIQESAISKHISKLKAKGLLIRLGGTRGHWQVVNPNQDPAF